MKVKVLVVDDEAEVRRTLSSCLRNIGHETIHAATGEEAISVALSDPPDVILMDLGLPGMSGLETAAVIKQYPRLAGIPIIALSARPPKTWREPALQAGITIYLSKPASLSEILQAIAKVLSDPVRR